MNYEIEVKLKAILEEKNMTQMQLSQLSGVRQSTISDIVRGTRTVIGFDHLTKISKALNLTSITQIIDFKKWNFLVLKNSENVQYKKTNTTRFFLAVLV